MFRAWTARAFILATVLALGGACSSPSAEGDSCDLANGNDDCEHGLVCRGSWEINASSSVCCPRPPEKPSTSACQPKVKAYQPNPAVDASPIPPGTGGSGGSAGSDGSAGSAGAGGSAGADASSGGTAGSAAGGSAGSSGSAGAGTDSGTD